MKFGFFSLIVSFFVAVSFQTTAVGKNTNELVIVGTGSGSELLHMIVQTFMREFPNVSITVPESIGSGGGIKAVGNDEYRMGRVARDIKDSERGYELTVLPVANIPVGFFVNAAVPLTQITPEQACGIFNGTIRRWESLCEKEGNIRIIRREEGDSTLTVLRKAIPCFSDLQITPRSKLMFSDPSTIAECAAEPAAITFGSWANVKDNPNIRMLALDGVSPSDSNYPLTTPLRLIYKQKNYNGSLKDFVEYIISGKANAVIRDAGGTPLQPDFQQ